MKEGPIRKQRFIVPPPPRLFLSYRWGDNEFNVAVRIIAKRLRACGWDVVYDQNNIDVRNRDIATLVSQLVACKVYVAIVTPSFLDETVRIGRASWLFDEWQTALSMGDNIHLVALWWEGEESPPSFDEIIDLRGTNEAEIDALRNQNLRYDGYSLSQEETRVLASTVERVRNTEKLSRRDFRQLRKLSKRFPFVGAIKWELCKELYASGKKKQAVEEITIALEQIPHWDGIVRFPHLLMVIMNEDGADSHCAGLAVDVLSMKRHDLNARYFLGVSLYRMSEFWSARNQLLIAAAFDKAPPSIFAGLGDVYLKLGFRDKSREMQDYARRLGEYSTEAYGNFHLGRMRLDRELSSTTSSVVLEESVVGCTTCPAVYRPTPGKSAVCGRCAAHRPAAPGVQCPYCGHSGVVLPSFASAGIRTFCPTCNSGELIEKSSFVL